MRSTGRGSISGPWVARQNSKSGSRRCERRCGICASAYLAARRRRAPRRANNKASQSRSARAASSAAAWATDGWISRICPRARRSVMSAKRSDVARSAARPLWLSPGPKTARSSRLRSRRTGALFDASATDRCASAGACRGSSRRRCRSA